MKITLKPENLKHIRISKHRNSKNKPIQYVDSSGKIINGNPMRHFVNENNLQVERFNNKFEAFSLLTQQELKVLFDEQPKDKIKSNTDKSALIQAYYNSCFEAFKAQSSNDLDLINGVTLEALDNVQKQALIDAKEIKKKEVEIIS